MYQHSQHQLEYAHQLQILNVNSLLNLCTDKLLNIGLVSIVCFPVGWSSDYTKSSDSPGILSKVT